MLLDIQRFFLDVYRRRRRRHIFALQIPVARTYKLVRHTKRVDVFISFPSRPFRDCLIPFAAAADDLRSRFVRRMESDSVI